MQDIQIIYQDDSIIAVNKPAGITTIPSDTVAKENALNGMVERMCGQKLFVVHRLDKGTSGAVVFAKNAESHRSINMQFDQRKVEKKYIGIVKGCVDFQEKEIKIPISKSKAHSKKVALARTGIEAITRVSLLGRFDNYSLLGIVPLTGRRHQIRLHLKAIGHPLAVDPLYGRKEPIYVSDIVGHGGTNDKLVISRTPLHAGSISFMHPTENKIISIKADIPEDMSDFLKLLRG
ncbi:MAG: RluA family pseudouridine synthase [Candidatus Margulisiibacteriota bacterium]